MNNKMNKWLCKTFPGDKGNVTIGSVLLEVTKNSILSILVLWISMWACTVLGFGLNAGYNYHVCGIQVENTDPDFYMDISTGFIAIISSIIVLFCVNKIYSYKITSCKKGN